MTMEENTQDFFCFQPVFIKILRIIFPLHSLLLSLGDRGCPLLNLASMRAWSSPALC